MDKEVSAILETVNNALAGLPPLASDAFDVLVKGTRITGVVGLVEDAVLLVIGYFAFSFLFRLAKNPKIYDDYDSVRGSYIVIFITFTLVFGTLSIIGLLCVAPNIIAIIMPEYSLIKSILETVNY